MKAKDNFLKRREECLNNDTTGTLQEKIIASESLKNLGVKVETLEGDKKSFGEDFAGKYFNKGNMLFVTDEDGQTSVFPISYGIIESLERIGFTGNRTVSDSLTLENGTNPIYSKDFMNSISGIEFSAKNDENFQLLKEACQEVKLADGDEKSFASFCEHLEEKHMELVNNQTQNETNALYSNLALGNGQDDQGNEQ